MDELEKGVQHSISNIQRSVKAYVFDGDDPAYRVVAVELRKLLLDTNAASSFEKVRSKKNKRNLFELYYGNGKNIYLRSFLSPRGKERTSAPKNYMDVSPNIYKNRSDILYIATHERDLVKLSEWLDEAFVYDRNGSIMKVRTVLGRIADKEGAHIISTRKDDREDIRIAFAGGPPSLEEAESLNYIEHWEQFVIDAGMRLLDSRKIDGSLIMQHNIAILTMSEKPMRLQKVKSTEPAQPTR